MWLRLLKGERGSAAVVLMGALPIMICLMAMVIWIGQVSYIKSRLQIAVDRAAYAGASYMAHALNSISVANWKIYKAYRSLERDFVMESQQNEEAAKQRIDKYEALKNEQIQKISSILGSVEVNVDDIALRLLEANAPGSFGETEVDAGFVVAKDVESELQWKELSYNIITGQNFIDPDNVDGGSVNALKYLVKKSAPNASVVVMAKKDITPIILNALVGGDVSVITASAAKAYGGSIKKFALKGGDSIDDAAKSISEEGGDYLYRSAIVPMWTVGVEGTSY
ncbi:MAG: Tad domain-containing protein [Deltaproteobacteria bacterium]|jgi:hypothetical protein|nr:Tad domain-containing protein [Deltaproteobacteria bacterium]